MMCRHQRARRSNKNWSCSILLHDSESLNDMLGHGSIVLPNLLDADKDLTAEQCRSQALGVWGG